MVHTIGVCGGGAWIFGLRVGRVKGCCRPCTRRGGMHEVVGGYVHTSRRAHRLIVLSMYQAERVDLVDELGRIAPHETSVKDS